MDEIQGGPGVLIPADVIPRLTEVPAGLAARHADPQPVSAIAVATTRRTAWEAVYGHDPDSMPPGPDSRVYVVAMTGRFERYRDGSSNRETPPRAGPYLSVVIDAATFELRDWAVGDAGPFVPLSRLGPLTELTW